MRYFLDFEFDEESDPVRPISLGIAADDGRTFYALFDDGGKAFDESCNLWVRQNVLPILGLHKFDCCGDGPFIARCVETFVNDGPHDEPVEFWGYFADFDWYLFVRMWGSFRNMPAYLPKLCFDIKQLHSLSPLVVYPLPTQTSVKHNALNDALWTREAFHWLNDRLTITLR